MDVKLGTFRKSNYEEKKKITRNLKKEIIIEDNDLCENYHDFEPYASVDLNLQDLKCGKNYRNTINGLLFKETKPHYVGKLRCILRINEEKTSENLENFNVRKYHNLLVPGVNFVTSDQLPEYWLELVEKLKNREHYLSRYSINKDGIMTVIKKNKIDFSTKNKDQIFLLLESMVGNNSF